MLWYKAWRESRTRFLLSALAVAGLCTVFVIMRGERGQISGTPLSYVEYIWRIVYKDYLREIFALLCLLLGVGGLLREREYGTAWFTLALPVSRMRIVLARAGTGIAEIAVLSALPALVIPPLSKLAGENYEWSQAWQFSLLWAVGGSLIFVIGFLASILFAGEYTAPVVAFLALLVYSAIADLPFVEHRFPADVHDLMSGNGMPWFRAETSRIIGPLPWMALGIILIAIACLAVMAGRVTEKQDY